MGKKKKHPGTGFYFYFFIFNILSSKTGFQEDGLKGFQGWMDLKSKNGFQGNQSQALGEVGIYTHSQLDPPLGRCSRVSWAEGALEHRAWECSENLQGGI